MTSKLKSVFEQDLDELFAYRTNISLVLKDKKVGICVRVLQILLLIYFTIIVFFFEKGYHRIEVSDGLTLLHSSGAGIGRVNQNEQRVWDALDISSSYIEGDNIFIATKSAQHYGQKVDNCSDFYRSCNSNDDCITFIGELCKESRCYGPNWCTPEGSTDTVEYEITDHYFIWIKSQTRFNLLGKNQEFNSIKSDKSIMYPDSDANTYSIGQILTLAGASYKEIREEGAIFKVNIFWDCEIGSSCSPTLEVKRLDKFGEDSFLGAYEVKYSYYIENGITYRNTFNMTGLRFIFDSKAKGKKLVFEVFVLQIATLLASVCIIYHICDFAIRNFFKRGEKLKQKKYIIPPEEDEDEELIENRKSEDEREGSHEERRHLIEEEELDESSNHEGHIDDDVEVSST